MSTFGGKADIGRITAMLALRGHFGDSKVADVTALALRGLVQQVADVA
jgi:hypothetical protein